MNSKLLFFDIDGTLVGFDGRMPDSTVKALRIARENGHKCFLCSGRSRNQIYPFLLEMEFDGIVAAAGGYVEYQGQVLFHKVFGEALVKKVLDVLNPTGAAMIFQAADTCVACQRWKSDFDKIFSNYIQGIHMENNPTFKQTLINEDVDAYPSLYPRTESVIYSGSPYSVEKLNELLSPDLKVTMSSLKEPDPASGEITLAGINKATGIQVVMEALGVSREDVIGFGDGANDLDMLQFAGVGVAMGNGQDCAKEAADLIAEDLAQDGLSRAMKQLGLLKKI